ncbi:aquaporin [Streptomyces sp. NPDC001970]
MRPQHPPLRMTGWCVAVRRPAGGAGVRPRRPGARESRLRPTKVRRRSPARPARRGSGLPPCSRSAGWCITGGSAFPGRDVVPYVLAQLAGSAAGTGLARLAWGRSVSLPSVDYAAIMPAPTWQPVSVFLAEARSMAAIVLVVGFLLAHTRFARLLPYAIGLSVALVIALLGTRSGGSINPARQLGPAAFAGQTTDLWIYPVAPILGEVLGAWLDHVLRRSRLPAREVRAAVSADLSRDGNVPAVGVSRGSARHTPASTVATTEHI